MHNEIFIIIIQKRGFTVHFMLLMVKQYLTYVLRSPSGFMNIRLSVRYPQNQPGVNIISRKCIISLVLNVGTTRITVIIIIIIIIIASNYKSTQLKSAIFPLMFFEYSAISTFQKCKNRIANTVSSLLYTFILIKI